MLRKTIVVFALITVANMSQSHDILNPPECEPHTTITAATVRDIRICPAEPDEALEIRWHNIESSLVTLHYGNKKVTSKLFLSIWEISDKGTKARSLAGDESFSQVELLPDMIIVGTTDGKLLFWDFWQGEFLREIPVSAGEISELLLHPSNQWLLIGIDNAQHFQFDLESQSLVEIQLQGAEEVTLNTLTFSEDGHLLAGGGRGTIRIWDTGSWEEWEPQRLPPKLVKGLQFTKDKSHLIVMADAPVSRWSLANERLTFVRELEALPDKRPCEFNDGDISPDGSLLMTTDGCSQIRAWDLTRDAEIYIPQLDSSNDDFPGMATLFHPDGRFLAVAEKAFLGLLYVHEDE
ncbi:MAG: hypothetical protein OXG78_04690 [Chloroflexi bacterium]|nr:hypothetical protein [Chloroflexota bacterium]